MSGWGIRARLVAMTVALLAVAVGSLALVAHSAAERLMRDGIERHADALVESVGRAIALPMAAQDEEALLRQLDAFASNPDVLLIEVSNPAGATLARVGRLREAPRAEAAAADRVPEAAQASKWVETPSDGAAFECQHAVPPLPESRDPVLSGSVRVVVSSARSEQTLRRLEATLSGSAAVLLAAGWLAAVWLGRRVAGPLERLTEAACAVASGRLEVDVPADGPGEAGVLARAFRTMTLALREQRQRLREAAERELERARTDWDTTFNAISDPIAVFDVSGRLVKANAAFGRRARRPGVEGEWLRFVEAGTGPVWSSVAAPGDPAASTHEAIVGDTHFSATTFPIPDAAGTVSGRVVVLRDVTERDRLRDRLVQSEKLTALGLLVSGVAHELNNPLAGMLGFAELALRGDPPAGTRRYLEKVQVLGGRVRRILTNLLTFARSHPPERTAVDLNGLVGQALELRAYDHSVSRISVSADLDPGLVPISGDAHQLQQVLMNLVINAEQAIGPRGGHLTIRTRRRGEQRVELAVEDDGPGIPAEHLARIFDPFFTTKPVGEGTGLGLSLALGIVRDHGGSVAAENRVEGGARVSVVLPLAELPLPAPPTAPDDARPWDSRTIVVVDDEPDLVQLVSEALGLEGHRVVGHQTVEAALAALRRSHPDLVVADLRMPGKDGRDLYAMMQAESSLRDVPVVFMTGDVANPRTDRFLDEGGFPVLRKPFALEELAALVAAHLPRRSRAGLA